MTEDLPLPILFTEEELDSALYPPPQPTAPVAPKYDPLAVLERTFPRIHQRVNLLWGSVELYNYLNDMILDDRHFGSGKERQGFPKEVLEALLHIHKQHSKFAGVIEHIPIADKWTNCK